MTVKINPSARYYLRSPESGATLLVLHAAHEDEIDQQSSATETVVSCALTTQGDLERELSDWPHLANGMQVFQLVPVKVSFAEVQTVVKKARLSLAQTKPAKKATRSRK